MDRWHCEKCGCLDSDITGHRCACESLDAGRVFFSRAAFPLGRNLAVIEGQVYLEVYTPQPPVGAYYRKQPERPATQGEIDETGEWLARKIRATT